MYELPDHVYPVEVVRDIDRCAIQTHGIPGYALMTRAAAAALEYAQDRWPQARHWHFFAGPGNNAGDAYVMARLARAEGYDVALTAIADPQSLAGDALTAANEYLSAGGRVEDWQGHIDSSADLLVDGLFGSGLGREIDGTYRDVIEHINRFDAPTVALDIPSGIAGDSGHAMGIAVDADLTVCFVGLKPGYFLGDGIDYTGHLAFAGLEVPEACYPQDRATLVRVSEAYTSRLLPRRRRNAHKGDFGHVLVAGGTRGMPGAVLLAAMAALRTGAGRVTVATHPDHASDLVARCPELMIRGVSGADDLEGLLSRATVVALGPGMDRDDWSKMVYDALESVALPSVWDAGALTLLAERDTATTDRIITPHPGEAARLLGWHTSDVQAHRLDTLRELVGQTEGVVALKGARTLIGGPGQIPCVSTAGNPGMSTAGMGDVLTGIIAALRAQGADAYDAACAGVDLHARAGDLAARQGERGTIASDLFEPLRNLVNP